ncbi:hypothetical protein G4G28_04180 [Massilia sp. Dwa41.01b]|uniref:hypothetical protein n=1 Tax=Massilia sp. Dwa41.01b TaxID=2709302 RepID=UPI001600E0E7|nr:hypothetical protein [Massilia sp. Dwa41.01b]QNA87863.1 hypothetical protein G4G28_04180 [Massilia sp. Dwa41.01b]
MSDKHKGMVNEHGRSMAREKMVPVAEGSQQGRAPGAVAASAPNSQSWTPNSEQRPSGNMQSENLSADQASVGGQRDRGRGGVGTRGGGWSARQKGQRMQARAEEDRLGMSQQSGYGGLEQNQRAGSQESPAGPGSRQSGDQGSENRGHPEQPASSYGSANSGGGKDNT